MEVKASSPTRRDHLWCISCSAPSGYHHAREQCLHEKNELRVHIYSKCLLSLGSIRLPFTRMYTPLMCIQPRLLKDIAEEKNDVRKQLLDFKKRATS